MGIMWDIVPACVFGLETLALIERPEEKLHVTGNNWDRGM